MLDDVKQLTPKIVTGTLVVVATIAAYVLYTRYMEQPWTRDGQVRAVTVKIAPRVEGYLTQVAVKDNQFVRQGDLLFQIDPSNYQLAVDQAEVALDEAREDVAALEAALRAAKANVQQKRAAIKSAEAKVQEAEAGIVSAQAASTAAESGIVSARAIIAQNQALLEEAQREAKRAQRLADKRAGSVETAESKAAEAVARQADLDNANAGLKQAEAALTRARAGESEAQANRAIAQRNLEEAQAGLVTGQADRDKAQATLGQSGDANVRVRQAKVQLEQAQLNLSWTSIYAPADGYITNMDLLTSTYVSPGTPFALFVDASSFRVDGYFQETKLKHIQPGDRAIITLMGRHDRRLEGEIESIGFAINPPNLADTEGPNNLIPTIQPTFEWIRLAQRVPVRIRLAKIPDDLHLVAGMTVSIAIQK